MKSRIFQLNITVEIVQLKILRNMSLKIAREIHQCPLYRSYCPVANMFRKNAGGQSPVPEAYRGDTSKAKLMIIGINPGICINEAGHCVNEYSSNFEEYLAEISQPLDANRFWQYKKAASSLGYDFINETLVTNILHCPTRSWSNRKYKEWLLNSDEKLRSIELCFDYCRKLIGEIKPDTVLLHGLDVIDTFRDKYQWHEIPQKPRTVNIQGKRIEWNGVFFVLSRHLQSIRASSDWKKLKI